MEPGPKKVPTRPECVGSDITLTYSTAHWPVGWPDSCVTATAKAQRIPIHEHRGPAVPSNNARTLDHFRPESRPMGVSTQTYPDHQIAVTKPVEPTQALTARERQVLLLTAEGLTSKEIAGRLGIS